MPIKIFSILFYLLPLALVTGPFLSDLFLSLIAIFFIYETITKRNFVYYKNYFIYFFILWYFLNLVNSFFSENIFLSLEGSLFYFRYLFFVLATMYLIDNNKHFVKIFFYSMLITLFLVVIDGYYQVFYGYNFYGIPIQIDERLLLFKSKIIGQYLTRLMPLLFALYAFQKFNSKYKMAFAMLFLIFMDILVFMSGERTAFALLTLGTILIVFNTAQFRSFRLIAFILSILIIAVIAYSSDFKRDRMINSVVSQGTQFVDQGNEEVVLLSEKYHSQFEVAYKMFKEKPIFGHGIKLFRQECNDYKYKNIDGCSTHPHNMYLQLLSETGLIGTLPIIFIFFYILSLFVRQFYGLVVSKDAKYSDYQICLCVAIFLTLWPLSPSFNIFNNWISIIYFMPVGFLLHSFRSNKKNFTVE